MKKKIFLIIFFLLILFKFIYAKKTDIEYQNFLNKLYKKSVQLIYPEELSKIIDNKNIHILDTRTYKEYNISHIKNARLINYKKFKMNDVSDIPKNSTIIVYCSIGYRSERIGEKLLKNGYKNVYNLYGGIFEWFNQGYKIYKDNIETNEIHGYSPKWGKWLKKGKIIYN